VARLLFLLVLALASATPGRGQDLPEAGDLPTDPHGLLPGPPPIAVEAPLVGVAGVELDLAIQATSPLPWPDLEVEVRGPSGDLLAAGVLTGDETLVLPIAPVSGTEAYTIHLPAAYAMPAAFDLRAIPGVLTLVPPALAILLALFLRQVVPALAAGVWAGAWLVTGSPFGGFLALLDRYVMGELFDRDHLYILVFSMLLGGMVGILSRSGGTAGLVEVVSRRATERRRGQFFTWVLGLVIFFDDYANTLVVGNTMRPITDRLRISREKLAYIVDSTAAPVASLALVSTWIGFEVSLIGDSLEALGTGDDAYWVFLQSIPYSFYPILALATVLLIAVTGRDFGPMLRAERRAAGGALTAASAAPLSSFDHPDLNPEEGAPKRWVNAVLPVVCVLAVTFTAQFLLGRGALAEAGDPLAATGFWDLGLRGFGTVFAAGDSFRALLYGAATGCLVAVLLTRVQGILKVEESIRSWVEGMKTMHLAFVILALAWAIGAVCRDLDTAGYLVHALSGNLSPRLLPLLIFVFAAVIAFSTGSSWSTMSILVPLAVPTAFGVAGAAGWTGGALHQVLVASVASVLAGAIFGDHCSPISDTTILSSMASACDHVDHVRTQLPYALFAATVAMLLGSVPTGFGISPWISNLVGLGAVTIGVRYLGKPIES
jgi:Na+/H+ antiporter NhaC